MNQMIPPKNNMTKMGYISGSFGTCGTRLGGLLRVVEFSVGMMLAGDYGLFGGGGGAG